MKAHLLIIFTCLFTVSIFAQPDRERIKALKVSFITDKLDLTVKEAQEFWPVYNAFDDNYSKIRFHDIRIIRREIKQNLNTLTDAKAQELLDRLIEAENKLHKERTDLVLKLKKIISPQKIILLKAAEEDFNRKMISEFKKRRKEFGKRRE